MDTQIEGETNYNICQICQNDNHYVRMKLFPCKNEECDKYYEKVDDVCNKCIRKIQRSEMLCPFCNQNQLQINQFGQYRNPSVKKFTIGLLSTKYLNTSTKAFKENPNYNPNVYNASIPKYIEEPIGSFITLPVIPFSLAYLTGDTNQAKKDQGQGRICLSFDKFVQALEVMTVDEKNQQIFTEQDKQELATTKYCLDILFNTCRHDMVRCGTNQIFISGGYWKDLDFLYGIQQEKGLPIQFQARQQRAWRQYQEGILDQNQLIAEIESIHQKYKEIQSQKNPNTQETQIPFYYPYFSNTYLVELLQKDNSDFSIQPTQQLNSPRAFHQTVVTNDKIFVFGGICNGIVLDSIEVAEVVRDIASKITEIKEFQVVGSMTSPRAKFSAVFKPAVKCTQKNCGYFAQKEQNSFSCSDSKCPNHAYIYIAGGIKEFGVQQDQLTLERYNFQTQQCEEIYLGVDKDSILNQYIGMSIGYWNNDIFVFGGVPKNSEAFSKHQNAAFAVLKPGRVKGNEKIFSEQIISNQIQPSYLPQFTVSIPYQSKTEEEKSQSDQYRAFVIYSQNQEKFCFQNFRIYRNSNDEIKLSNQIQSLKQEFQFINKKWNEQGFQDEQSFILLNSFVDQ
ncbi:hypothetical protein TTHERM_00784680 (macronuclear) [Tetrahymena thermophila SB210]|uniref:RING-type domain-containing protein n=1 Tax=Tetrahymena thermophila (strain SB210) TaxID=312017 RepID=Q231M1_TETTS|nr:hypothetical protein TTHERM_00784680 [Tetrahymena thermophila SB210]EAR91281.1 hypothetical protein TTHERM_00784680 [Tetrahymena thermophila SB210]|eukprot:XP_001011526.1 hypothetical protein TTHERM_00784680 [Tetrahymena thermophila SB210]